MAGFRALSCSRSAFERQGRLRLFALIECRFEAEMRTARALLALLIIKILLSNIWWMPSVSAFFWIAPVALLMVSRAGSLNARR
jgi:hypothetical protein